MKTAEKDSQELYQSECDKVEKVMNAPHLPITLNYKKENMP